MRPKTDQDARYEQAVVEYGPMLQRLARACEADAERRRDLLQDMHIALWRSFAGFDNRCAVRTWVYRIAHNVAATHVAKERRNRPGLVTLDEIDDLPEGRDLSHDFENDEAIRRLYLLIRALKPPDRQIITLYLEGLDAAGITEVTGLSSGAVATRVARLKIQLARMFNETANV